MREKRQKKEVERQGEVQTESRTMKAEKERETW